MPNNVGYTGLSAYTLAPEPNSSYLSYTKGSPVTADPISGSTVGLMMMLSSLQYQAPTMNPMYSAAADKAGQAAFIQSGGQAFQDKFTSVVTKKGAIVAHDMGITDGEMGIVGGTYKAFRTRQIDLKGPKIYSVGTSLTMSGTSGILGVRYDF